MKPFKLYIVLSLLTMVFFISGCKKDSFQSRDTSGLKPPPPPPPPVVDPTLVSLDDCDNADGWETVGTPTVVTTGQKQGDGYIQGILATGNDFLQFIKTLPTPVDTKLSVDNGQFRLWINIPDPSVLKLDGQIQISSAANPDSKRYGWAFADIIPGLKAGWNQLTLNLSDANVAGDGPADLSAINYFKIFFWSSDKMTSDMPVGIDGLEFRARPTDVVEQNVVEVDNCDDVTDWFTVGTPVLATSGQKQGSGYLQGTLTAGNDFLQFYKTYATPINTKVTMSTGQLQLWFYAEDVSKLKLDGQIQFSSSGDPDKNRIGWAMADIIPNLKNGWNQLKLNFSSSGPTADGGPDLSAMNFVKVFFWTTDKVDADIKFGLDDIKVVEVPPPPPVTFDNCDEVVDGWETVGAPQLVTTGQKEGDGYIQGRMPTGTDFIQFIRTLGEPLDTKVTVDNGQLDFWLNIPDVSKLKLDGQIQVSSSASPDSKRYGWALAGIIPDLKNGWNHLTLNLSEADMAGDGPADLSAVNFFKVFFWTTDKAEADVSYGIDAITFKQK